MKRIICLALCALAALLACACDNTKDSTPTQAPQEETQAQQTPDSVPPTEDGNSLSLKKFINSFDKKPTVAEQKKLYDDENLSVTVKGIDYTAVSGPQLQLNIENKSNKEIVAQSPYSIVNDYMITPELNSKIAVAKSADCTLTLPYFKLAISGITSIKKVEFAVRLVDAKTYNPITTTDLIAVETSAKQDEEVECDESGQVAYDKDDIKIIFKGVNIDRAYSDGAELMVYMYNGTDQKIAVMAKDVVVNGYTMTSAMNSTILPNKRAVDVVTFYKLDMEEHDIVDIDSIKVSFTIKDADNWETIDSTDMISVTIPEKPTAAATVNETTK